MGSSFSIVNDTLGPIWVSDGVCHAALWGSIGGALGVVSLGAATIATVAGGTVAAAAATFLSLPATTTVITLEGVLYTTAQAAGVVLASGATALGMSAGFWTAVGSISTILAVGSGITSGLSGPEKQKLYKMKEELEEKLSSYTQLNPGERYTTHGTLSLIKTAYVIYDNGRMATCDVWTGPTAGSDHEYPASKYF